MSSCIPSTGLMCQIHSAFRVSNGFCSSTHRTTSDHCTSSLCPSSKLSSFQPGPPSYSICSLSACQFVRCTSRVPPGHDPPWFSSRTLNVYADIVEHRSVLRADSCRSCLNCLSVGAWCRSLISEWGCGLDSDQTELVIVAVLFRVANRSVIACFMVMSWRWRAGIEIWIFSLTGAGFIMVVELIEHSRVVEYW